MAQLCKRSCLTKRTGFEYLERGAIVEATIAKPDIQLFYAGLAWLTICFPQILDILGTVYHTRNSTLSKASVHNGSLVWAAAHNFRVPVRNMALHSETTIFGDQKWPFEDSISKFHKLSR
jgi:hypothetical protein